MSKVEKEITRSIKALSNKQLLSIKNKGTGAPEYESLEDLAGGFLYRDFILGRAASEMIQRGLIDVETEFDLWWDALTD